MKRILILLASETERVALSDVLKEDYNVTLCGNQSEAAMCLQQDYDAVILDLFLPEIDGLTFLLDHQSCCPPVIILMTQLISSKVLTQSEEVCVDVLLRKPCDMSVVRNYLARLLVEKNPSRVTGRGMKSQEDTPVRATQNHT